MFRFAAVFVALLAIAAAAPVDNFESLDFLERQSDPTATPEAEPSATATASAQPMQPSQTVNPEKISKGKTPAPASPSPSMGTAPAAGPGAGSTSAEQAVASPSPMADSEAMPEESMAAENTAPPCFPAAATVLLESGLVKKMADLVVGDRVNVGKGQFSDVYMFTHKMASVKYSFVQLKTASGATLRLTDGHFLPINGQYLPAKAAALGDVLILADGSPSNIVDIATVKDEGLFNPQTTHGDIVVDGIQASTYTTAVSPNMAHALLAPLRTICNRFGMQVRFLESGADAIRSIVA